MTDETKNPAKDTCPEGCECGDCPTKPEEVTPVEVPANNVPLDRNGIINRIKELNQEYKGLVGQKNKLAKELTKLDEEILKRVGAYKELNAILQKMTPEEPKETKAPEKK